MLVAGACDAFERTNRVVGSLPKRCACVEVSTYAKPVVDAVVILYVKVTCTAVVVGLRACLAVAFWWCRQFEVVGCYIFKSTKVLETLIHQFEQMQNRASKSNERIRQIDKEIADLGARNLVISKLHTNGVLNAVAYSAQSSEINNKIAVLRTERKKKLAEDEDDELLDTLKTLNEIIEEYQLANEFDEELFEQIVERITVNDNTSITFHLIGGVDLTEEINEKGRCKSA